MTSSRTRRVTALLLCLLVLLGSGGCTMGANPLQREMTVTAYFPTATGLFTGNDVGILGVKVGRVDRIVPEGDRVKVVLKVDADQPVPATAGAVVVSRSAATDRYVELTPVWASGPKMRDGAVIPLSRTRTPVEFDEVLGTLGSFAEQIGGDGPTRNAVRRLLSQSAHTLAGHGQLLNDSVTGLSAATGRVHEQRGNAEQTLVALDQLTTTVARNQGTVRRFVTQVSRASRLLAEERANFRTSLRAVTRMITDVADFAKENRAAMTRVVGHTNATLRTVLKDRDQVAEILRITPLAMQNLQKVVKPNGRITVRINPSALLPIGGLVQKLCNVLPGDLCTGIGLDPTVLVDNLLNLLGLGGRR